MKKNLLQQLCFSKKHELLESHFNEIALASVYVLPEADLVDYTARLTSPIEAEYLAFLRDLWNKERGEDKREFEQIMNKEYTRMCTDLAYRDRLTLALRDMQRITLWEQLTDTNYKDENRFRNLLRSYADTLMDNILSDFIEDIGC